MKKRLLCVILAIIVCIGSLPMLALGISAKETTTETAQPSATQDTIEYHGLQYQDSVIYREYTDMTAVATAEPLDVAYALNYSPYILLEETVIWDVVVSGGTAPYDCVVVVAYQSDLSADPYSTPWVIKDQLTISANSRFFNNFNDPGRYFLQFNISDSAGQSIGFQTKIYVPFSPSDELNDKTVPGKINSLVSSLIDDEMSDYNRALVLHDWLIYNANYDQTYSIHDPSGVLLGGSGVCDSYATAYMMLMTAAGVECLTVSGTAGNDANPDNWGNHAWNLIKLDGEWYHVDCTWDDPGDGGNENHEYFCVSDETLKKDHKWNTPGATARDDAIIPPTAGGKFEAEENVGDYDFTFSTIEEFGLAFDAEVEAGNYRKSTKGYYTGTQSLSTVWEELKAWASPKAQELANKGLITAAGYGYHGELFSFNLTWKDPDDYIRIEETLVVSSVGDTVTVKPSEYVLLGGGFTWTSDNTSVATVTEVIKDGVPTAYVTGIAEGSTKITVTSEDGISDEMTVKVLNAHQPDINLSIDMRDSEYHFEWSPVPGATEYLIMRDYGDTTEVLATIPSSMTMHPLHVSSFELPHMQEQKLYIRAVRKIGDTVCTAFDSEKYETIIEHKWFSTTQDNALILYCSVDCGATATLTLAAPENLKYDGNQKIVTVVGAPEKFDVPEVQYFRYENGDYYHQIYDAPYLPGKYMARLECLGAYIELEFTIKNPFTFMGTSLTLGDRIAMHFYMHIDCELYDYASMAFIRVSDYTLIDEIPVSEAVIDTTTIPGKTLHVFTCEVNAKEMNDVILADLNCNGISSEDIYYSVKQYADGIIENKHGVYDDETIALVKSMLNFGAYAQTYLEYNTDDLANKDLDDTDVSSVTIDYVKDHQPIAVTLDGYGSFVGSSLYLKTNTVLQAYFKLDDNVDISTLKFAVNGKSVTPVKSGDYYTITVDNIAASELDTKFSFTATVIGDESKTVTFYCSALSYCYSALSNNGVSAELQNVAKAIYLYNQAANAYAAKNN